jgi:hypothetical protein
MWWKALSRFIQPQTTEFKTNDGWQLGTFNYCKGIIVVLLPDFLSLKPHLKVQFDTFEGNLGIVKVPM